MRNTSGSCCWRKTSNLRMRAVTFQTVELISERGKKERVIVRDRKTQNNERKINVEEE